MLKIKFENLLVIFVLTIITGYDTIMTTMLNRSLPNIPVVLLICVVLLLIFRFLFIKKFSSFYIVSSILLILTSIIVFLRTGGTNFLLYSLLIILLYQVDVDVVLKTYVGVSGTIVLLIFLLSILGVVPNLQFAQIRSSSLVVRNSFGFIYPTDFASHCFYLYTAISYIFRKKFIVLRTALGFGLAYFIIRYCDARLNAASITVMALIFLYFYFRNDKQRRLFALLPLSAGIASSVMIYLSSKFTWSHPMYVALNNFFSMRLHLGHEALKKYAVQWFGIRGISFVGYGGRTESVLSYDYVDSSYVQMLFTYGMIPVLLLVVLYIVRSWSLYRKKNYLLLTALSLIAVNCMFEAFWVRPSYNIFMFTLFATLPVIEFESKKSTTRNSL